MAGRIARLTWHIDETPISLDVHLADFWSGTGQRIASASRGDLIHDWASLALSSQRLLWLEAHTPGGMGVGCRSVLAEHQ